MEINMDWKTKLSRMTPGKQQLIILLLVGVLLVVIALPAKTTEEKEAEEMMPQKNSGIHLTDYEMRMEEKLEKTLQYVEGVGRVEVMITLRSTAEKVIEKDRENNNQQIDESDARGGERSTVEGASRETTIYKGTNENQAPYVKKEMTPEVAGVVIIAQGGGNPATVKNITEAVQALFDVDTHKIKIMKMNPKK